MKLYYAALSSYPELLSLLDRPNVLTSFIEKWRPDPKLCGSIFLDSGAYTAFRSGKPVDLPAYIRYCQHYASQYQIIAALDVIGDPDASYQNYVAMRNAGVRILPTFHIGSDWRYYDQLLDEYDYVAIGGVAWRVASGVNEDAPMMRALIHIHKRAQQKGVRLHGFGVTAWRYIRSFDWFSIDSTTFLVGARLKHILTYRNGTLGKRLRPEQRGLRNERIELSNYLVRTGFQHPYSTDDLLPLTSDTRQHVLNRLHFNCMVMQHAISKL